MCDTFVFVPADNRSPVIFGKNSDREPNEAQAVVRYPEYTRESGRVRATYIEVDAHREVHEVILSRPFQMWGAEMGVNACGVAIGNEAVFTRMPAGKQNTGLTGMDMVRLALEEGSTAAEALSIIIRYLEAYGQDACGGYTDKRFFYHNSFLVADQRSAFVLETAGRFWAWKEVAGYRAISNGLSIESDYDEISAGAIDHAHRKRWTGRRGDFSFRKAFSAFWMPRLAHSEGRRRLNESKGASLEAGPVTAAFAVLRSHATGDFLTSRSKPGSLCMHASGLFCPHQTTSSMVAVLRKDGPPTTWLTASSAPCLSLFKPFYFGCDVLEEGKFHAPAAQADDSYWWRAERFHRDAIRHYYAIIDEVQSDQALLEHKWSERDREAVFDTVAVRNEFSRECIDDALAVLESWQASLSLQRGDRPNGSSFLYRRFWNKLNRKVNI
jgi:dipeptidase